MYTMVLMMAMSGSGDQASWGFRGGCHGGSSCHGYVAASSCCGPVAAAPVSYGCYGSSCYGGGSCHGRGGFLGLCNHSHSCHGGFLGSRHSCHGGGCYGYSANTCCAPTPTCCAPVNPCGCTGMTPGMMAPGMMVPGTPPGPVTMPPATGAATPATPAKDKKPQE